MTKISFLKRILDLVSPRCCAICNGRLAPGEDTVCLGCNLRLPRTDHFSRPYDNALARMFWGRVPCIERAVALTFHHSGAQAAFPIYLLKYLHRPEVGTSLGGLLAREMQQHGLFDGIDLIVPVPLSHSRQMSRGYNQSEMIARGMSEVCGLPVATDVLKRHTYKSSQTTHGRWGRNDNVEHAFTLHNGSRISHRHVLLVDDIVTTGATLCACARQMAQVEGTRISIAALGFADPDR